tara:strand:+ start:339 stop:446 length:108 start_codon:yes stop_codon:yes gene_type:complete
MHKLANYDCNRDRQHHEDGVIEARCCTEEHDDHGT